MGTVRASSINTTVSDTTALKLITAPKGSEIRLKSGASGGAMDLVLVDSTSEMTAATRGTRWFRSWKNGLAWQRKDVSTPTQFLTSASDTTELKTISASDGDFINLVQLSSGSPVGSGTFIGKDSTSAIKLG